MFGTNDDTQQSNDDPAMLDNVKQLANEPAHVVEPPQQTAQFTQTSAPEPNFSATHTVVAEPAQGFSSSPLPSDPASPMQDPVVSSPSPVVSAPSEPVSSTQSPVEPVDTEHLAGMKQEALQHLEPLVEHLDGSPEETFKTTMMMIQANDNHTLLEKALEAAKKIEDDKVRAQAMLDIVNEINYFSQNNSNN